MFYIIQSGSEKSVDLNAYVVWSGYKCREFKTRTVYKKEYQIITKEAYKNHLNALKNLIDLRSKLNDVVDSKI